MTLDEQLIASLRLKVERAGTHEGNQRVTVDWSLLERLLDLADVALRYRRLANERQKKAEQRKKTKPAQRSVMGLGIRGDDEEDETY